MSQPFTSGRTYRRSRSAQIQASHRAICESLERRQLLTEVTSVIWGLGGPGDNYLYVSFSGPVDSSTIQADDLWVEKITGPDSEPIPEPLSLSWQGNIACFTYNEPANNNFFPNGNYRATLSGEDMRDASGNPIANDSTSDFCVLFGDLDADRSVTQADVEFVESMLGSAPGAGYGMGDLNFDGDTDETDVAIVTNLVGATMPIPPTVGTITAGNQTESSIELNWVDNVDGEQGWRVQISEDGQNFDTYFNRPTNSTTFFHLGLAEGTRYWYRVRAYGYGKDTAYTPKRGATTILRAPEELEIPTVSATELLLTWSDRSAFELGFNIYRSDCSTGPWEPAGWALAEEESFLDSGLDDNQHYYYALETFTQDATSARRYVDAATPLGPPDAPSDLVAASTVAGRIDLSWDDNSDSEDGFVLERFDPDATQWTVLPTQTQPSYQDHNLTQGALYRYRVRATNAAGQSLYSNTASATPRYAVAAPPQSLAYARGINGQSTLSWQPGSNNATGFSINRRRAGAYTSVTIGWVGAGTNSYTYSEPRGPAQSAVFEYFVIAQNPAGLSAPSSMVTNGATPQAAPTGLSIGRAANNLVGLRWNDNSVGETGFVIEYWVPGQEWQYDRTADQNAQQWVVAPRSHTGPGQLIKYRVRAYEEHNALGPQVSAPSNEVEWVNPEQEPDPNLPWITELRAGVGALYSIYMTEGASGTVTVTRNASSLGQSVTVVLGISGDANPVEDYTGLPTDVQRFGDTFTITIEANSLSASVPLQAVQDSFTEPWERIRLMVLPDPAYGIAYGGLVNGGCYIVDDDYPVDIVAHRTGARFLEEVPETLEDDPTKLLLLVNDDSEEGLGASLDLSNNQARPTGANGHQGPFDDDLIRITLKPLWSVGGLASAELQASNPSAVRLFNQYGFELTSLSVNPLLGVDLWLEALQPDPDLTLALVLKDSLGNQVARDEVHAWITCRVDLDIDSDNNNGLGAPDRSIAEDAVEDEIGDDTKPGKVILVHNFDSDGDGIPNYADGYDLSADIATDDVDSRSFVPLVLSLGTGVAGMSKIWIDYDASNPLAVCAALDDPFVLPDGAMRLWMQGGNHPRDGRGFGDGGDYLAPGIYDANDLGLADGTSITLYAEVVSRSDEVADWSVTIALDPDGEGPAEIASEDRVRITGTEAQVLARNLRGSHEDIVATDRFVISDLSENLRYNHGFTPGAFQTYRIRIFDPRACALAQFFVDGQALPLFRRPDRWETLEFVAVEPGASTSWNVPYQIVAVGNGSVQLSYNPSWPFPSGPKVKSADAAVERLGKSIKDVVERMKAEDWAPKNPLDDGAFGKEVHARVSAQLAAEDPRWVADIYVRRTDKQILSIGVPPPGGVAGTAQVDLVYLKEGQQLQVGQIWDHNKYNLLAEIKTSIGGKISAGQKEVLKALNNGQRIFVTEGAPVMWKRQGGWQTNSKWRRVGRLLAILGAASAVWNIMHADDYDDELDAILAKADDIRSTPYHEHAGGEQEKVGDILEFQTMYANYLAHFTPDDTPIQIMQLLSAYDLIADMGE